VSKADQEQLNLATALATSGYAGGLVGNFTNALPGNFPQKAQAKSLLRSLILGAKALPMVFQTAGE
jgi:hypothetical protein